jgi:ATP-dependent DNA helicase RecQ
MAGKDTLALLPTGGGKSICFQVPGLALGELCIVVSPLIALMKDQVEQLQRRGIAAKAVYSGMSKKEVDIALDACVYGDIRFLYVSPERLTTELFLARVAKMPVRLLAIDEAHCISQWGYDFRPPYLQIAEFRKHIPRVPCIALTATATEVVKVDIQDKLGFVDAAVFQKSFARANLSYSVFFEENKTRRLLDMLQKVPGTSVVYVRNRKRTKEIADFLRRYRISADYYHAGLSNHERAKKQDDWIQDRTRVIVATNAFGMGIDKPNVRLVVHVDLPDSLEAYYQEAGRAGRDEKKAFATVLCHTSDLKQLLEQVETAHPPVEAIRKTYQALANYFKLAVGSGQFAAFDFQLDDFAKTYQLPYLMAYHSIKKLEEQGFIQLNEAFYSPSKVIFLLSNEALYHFQVANASLDPAIKMLLRCYGGELFTSFVNIQEKFLAEKMGLKQPEMVKVLEALAQKGVIEYEKQKDKPQLVFLTERYAADQLPLDVAQLKNRKAVYMEKARKVVGYMQDNSICRTRQLLAYFGEITEEKCGTCDVCVAEKKAGQRNEARAAYPGAVVTALQQGPLSLQVLTERVKPFHKEDFMEVIREMIDHREVQYMPNGELGLVAEGR